MTAEILRPASSAGMYRLRLATFNVENLIARYRFDSGEDPERLTAEGIMVNERAFQSLGGDGKALTREAVRACRADVVAFYGIQTFALVRAPHSSQSARKGLLTRPLPAPAGPRGS